MASKIEILSNLTDDDQNVIEVDSTSTFRGSSLSFRDRNAYFFLGPHSLITSCSIVLGTGAKLVVGANCVISGRISIGYGSVVTIGDGLQVTSNLNIRCVEATSITIGSDCLFASNIILRTTDGHPIYDARTRERMNKSDSICIGNHVWLGDDVMMLKGSSVGNASIVGARSVVTKKFPSNVACAGIPARIIRRDVTWEHRQGLRTEEYYLADPNEKTLGPAHR